MMDSILARASIAGQHINAYTGTDYSGIEELKKQIVEQEQEVEGCHKKVESTRSANHEAHDKQDVSQKEIVALLERKSSWTPDELERYMSLVRSEHANEQAVQAAKEDLTIAERDLEDARGLLERLERRQYHEEQIWSDTIRRNSTWVTFGLMGVNIVLLLAQIGIFEPYRRRKIVREVQKALDEKILASPRTEVEREIDQVVEPKGLLVEQIEESIPDQDVAKQPLDTLVPSETDAGRTLLAAGELLPEEAARFEKADRPSSSPSVHPGTWAGTWDAYKESFQDLFSERVIQLKKVDVTTTALQGAATGVAAMGILFVLFRPR
jgi:sensitive to high expression protein 9